MLLGLFGTPPRLRGCLLCAPQGLPLALGLSLERLGFLAVLALRDDRYRLARIDTLRVVALLVAILAAAYDGGFQIPDSTGSRFCRNPRLTSDTAGRH